MSAELSPQQRRDILEAALLTSPAPLSLEDMQRLFDDRIERSTLRMLLDELRQQWMVKPVELVQVASGWRFQARAEYAPYMAKLYPERQPRYSRAALETLAIIAYRQPVTRGDIEEIRGVAVNPNIMRGFLERGWIEAIGQREVPGRPSLYATTKQFLDDFNLKSLTDLPDMHQFTSAELQLDLEPPVSVGAPATA